MLTGGALKWPSVAGVNWLVPGEIKFSKKKCFRANRSLVSHWYAGVHQLLVSLEVSLLPKGFGTAGALVSLNASVHHLVCLERDLLCKRFVARGAMVVLGASVHHLVFLEASSLPKGFGTAGALVSLNTSVHHLVYLEMR